MQLHLPELALPDDLVARWPSSSFGGRRGRPSIPQPLPVTEMVRLAPRRAIGSHSPKTASASVCITFWALQTSTMLRHHLS